MLNLIDEANQALQEEGGRMTVQRRIILETIQSLSGHPTAEEIYRLAQQSDPSLNLSTVYRTLRWLEKLDLISTHYFNDDRHQERFDPVLADDHFHFRCTRCNAIIEFSDSQAAEIRKRFEFDYQAKVTDLTLVLYGLCPDCSASSSKDPHGKLS